MVTLDHFLNPNQEEKYVHIIFRKIVSEIPSTTYATHGLYGYPAKFIPHVVRFVLRKYSREGDWVFDPFAGYGTVAIEASLLGRNYIVWDLNPMLEIFVKASTFKEKLTLDDFFIDWEYSRKFIPKWKNLEYWHPREFIKTLSRLWGFFHDKINNNKRPVVAIPLLRLTKYFSYADLQVSKLYKSKKAKERVRVLLASNWRDLMRRMYTEYAKDVLNKVREYQRLNPKDVESIVLAGIDSLRHELKDNVNILITSPPYLQAQEYIRSFKLELFWLGFSEQEIRKLQNCEIPYNKPPEIKVRSETYRKYREKILRMNNHKLVEIYDAYFKSLAYFLEVNSDKIARFICIFVGPVKIRNIRIPIDEILKEVLENLGWRHEKTYIDKIVSRRLFRTEINPATGLPDERTKTEHLLIMKRK
ncbi:MAG: DNA methyltransferase [Candidatus Njordarchaeales archaeon]